jgi:hypothetical protein
MIEPVHANHFYANGRGPELQRVHWADRGLTLVGIDYLNPDEGSIKHVRFHGLQVFMVTPEEVIGVDQFDSDAFLRFPRAAMFNHGRSEWLRSFSRDHLDACSHFQLLFYDELFDIICEAVECGVGSLAG